MATLGTVTGALYLSTVIALVPRLNDGGWLIHGTWSVKLLVKAIMPPLATPPLSVITTVTVFVPYEFARVLKVSVPSGVTAGVWKGPKVTFPGLEGRLTANVQVNPG